MIVTGSSVVPAPYEAGQAPLTKTERLTRLFVTVLKEGTKLLATGAFVLLTVVLLPGLLSCAVLFLFFRAMHASESKSQQPALTAFGALARDVREAHDITRYLGSGECLQKADSLAESPKFIKIEPKERSKKSVPILYAPGYLDTPETLRESARRLAESTGCPVYIVKYRSLFQSILEHAKDVSRVRARMLGDTEVRNYILVGHSMGGLTTGHALREKNGTCLLWMTIASPLQGTEIAKFGLGRCAREMEPNSTLILTLNKCRIVSKVPSFHIYSAQDQIVPAHSAQSFKKLNAQEYLCKVPCGHLAVRSNPEVEGQMTLAVQNVLR